MATDAALVPVQWALSLAFTWIKLHMAIMGTVIGLRMTIAFCESVLSLSQNTAANTLNLVVGSLKRIMAMRYGCMNQTSSPMKVSDGFCEQLDDHDKEMGVEPFVRALSRG